MVITIDEEDNDDDDDDDDGDDDDDDDDDAFGVMEANHYHKMLWIVGCQRGRHVYFKGLPHYGNPPNHCRTQLIDHKV